MSRFAARVQEVMEKRQISIDAIAENTEFSTPAIKKIVEGAAFPSPNLARSIANALRADSDELVRLADLDRLELKKRHGFPMALVIPFNPKRPSGDE